MNISVDMKIETEDGHTLTDAEISDAYSHAVEILGKPETKDYILGKITEAIRVPAPKPTRRQCGPRKKQARTSR